ncbi:restriction endonuclease [Parapedobacter koreensis]|uniref:Restriction endonuclease n=1 Tax=Parapedobacter koreensis TaxID=332977 RepID=A0A1H7NJB7_9SPHI|nr:restriction endonuclease [Parapedobacter koreensis]SEL23650.1 Restriction endonuclease [Parapedobacter koreensis]
MEILEEDIDFKLIDWKQFEELCFDLLMKCQFHSLVWRQGGADSGRDIECVHPTSNPLIGPYDEKWFVECKHHTAGVSVNDIADKVAWAEAEKGVEHFMLITSSYVTVPAREWLYKKQESTSRLKIHWIEGKQLTKQLLSFPDVVLRYFVDDYTKLVKELYRQWVFHDILPEPKALYKLYKDFDARKLNYHELAFLWHAVSSSEEGIVAYCEDGQLEVFSCEFLISAMKEAVNFDYPVISEEEQISSRLYTDLGSYVSHSTRNDFLEAFYHEEIGEDRKIQIYIKREFRSIAVRIGISD